MSKSEDINNLSENLTKMSVSAPKVKKNYTLNTKMSYTKCYSCSYDLCFSKDAVVYNCKYHWYCSTQCRDKCKDLIWCFCELSNCTSLDSFYSLIQAFYDTETQDMVKEYDYVSSQEGVFREK